MCRQITGVYEHCKLRWQLSSSKGSYACYMSIQSPHKKSIAKSVLFMAIQDHGSKQASIQASINTHMQCSLTSVELARASPN